MSFPDTLTAKLRQPLDRQDQRVRTVKQRGTQVPYIPGHEVVDTLNADFGFGGWSKSVEEAGILDTGTVERQGRDGPYTNHWISAYARVTLRVGDAVYGGVGVCTAEGPVKEPPPFDTALMGAETVALRRAAFHLGNRYGNSLRDKDDPEGHGGSEMAAGQVVGTTPTSRAGKAVGAPPKTKPAPQPAQDEPPPPSEDDRPAVASDVGDELGSQADEPQGYAIDTATGQAIDPSAVDALICAYFEAHGVPPACVRERNLEPDDIGNLDRAQLLELWTRIHEEN